MPKERSRYLHSLQRYWRSNIKIWRPLAAEPEVGGVPVRACQVECPSPIIPESLVDLRPAFRPLGDLVVIAIWPYTRNARSR